MGRQGETALRLFVSDVNQSGGIRIDGARRDLALECQDDESDIARCAEIYRTLCARDRVDLILGPYSSKLARIAAPIAEQSVKPRPFR